MCRKWAAPIFSIALLMPLVGALNRASAATWVQEGNALRPVFDDEAAANYNRGSRGERDLADQSKQDGDKLNESGDTKRDMADIIGSDRKNLLNQLGSAGNSANNPAEVEAARQEILGRPYEPSKHGDALKSMLPTNKDLFDKGPQKQDELKADAEKDSKKGKELIDKAKQQRAAAAQMKQKGEVAAARREGLFTAGHQGGVVKPKEIASEIKVEEKAAKQSTAASKSTFGIEPAGGARFPAGEKARGLAGVPPAAAGPGPAKATEAGATKAAEAKEEEVLNHAKAREMVSKDFVKEKESDKEVKWAVLDGIVASKEGGAGAGTVVDDGSKAQAISDPRLTDRQIAEAWRAGEAENAARGLSSATPEFSLFYRTHRRIVVQQEKGNVAGL